MILIEEALAIDGVVSFKSLVAVKGVKEARDHITTARLLDLAALCDDVLIDFCFGLCCAQSYRGIRSGDLPQ